MSVRPLRIIVYRPHMLNKMFDNLGYELCLMTLTRSWNHRPYMMMRELGYYTAYKGKWHLTEKLEKPLPDEKMRILMSGIF